jgi:ribulose-5-phosphate 4-epimerase/fuculose-1-phosphate aldolase
VATHGRGVAATPLETAVIAAEELEETARIFLLLKDRAARPLDDAQIDELKSVFRLDI